MPRAFGAQEHSNMVFLKRKFNYIKVLECPAGLVGTSVEENCIQFSGQITTPGRERRICIFGTGRAATFDKPVKRPSPLNLSAEALWIMPGTEPLFFFTSVFPHCSMFWVILLTNPPEPLFSFTGPIRFILDEKLDLEDNDD